MYVNLLLSFDPPGARSPLMLARVQDPRLIRRAAGAAVRAAERKARALRRIDEGLANDATVEACQLRRTLNILVGPEHNGD
jgi:hypothetical protein